MSAKYFVNRQIYYYSGQATVEIVPGGGDFAGPDMLAQVYNREMMEHDDPLNAAVSAAMVFAQWKVDEPELDITFAVGDVGAFWFEPDDMTFCQVVAWAVREHGELPRCVECGEIAHLGNGGAYDEVGDYVDQHEEAMGRFCSRRCLESYEWKEAEYLVEQAKLEVATMTESDLFSLLVGKGVEVDSHTVENYRAAVCELLEDGKVLEYEVYF